MMRQGAPHTRWDTHYTTMYQCHHVRHGATWESQGEPLLLIAVSQVRIEYSEVHMLSLLCLERVESLKRRRKAESHKYMMMGQTFILIT